MAEKKTAKKYKRIVYCERCGHSSDRRDESGRCTAKTTRKGAPQCKCPRMVYPVGGYMASMGQRAAQEKVRTGEMPPPFEPPDEKKKKARVK